VYNISMDPINPIAGNPEALNQNTEAPKIPQPEKNNHWISILAVAIFILLALGAIAFLYYQNQQLKNMLANYQSQATSPPIPAATADPTANWKTYTNTEYYYSLKYPNDWNLRLFAGSQEQATTASSFAIEGPYQNIQTLQGGPDYSITVKVVAKQPADVSTPDKLTSSKVLSNNKYLEFDLISSIPNRTITDTQTFDQILSTFKFISPSPSPSPLSIPVSTSAAFPAGY
jgi:hypothetical protein